MIFSDHQNHSAQSVVRQLSGIWYLVAGLLLFQVGCALKQPSNNRNWSIEHAVLPKVNFFEDETVIIENVRNFRYSSKTCVSPQYDTRQYEIDNISTVDFFLTYFSSEYSFFAHSMLSFGNANQDDFVLVSIEARREVDEEYNFRAATMRELELIYVIADERDMVDYRAIIQGEKIYRYRLNLTPDQTQRLFKALLRDADKLNNKPQFYDLFKNNCINNLVEYSGEAIRNPIDRQLLNRFPGYAHLTLRRVGLIDRDLSVRQQRECARVNELALKFRNSPYYSNAIRRQWSMISDTTQQP